jgi:hypothetical protein
MKGSIKYYVLSIKYKETYVTGYFSGIKGEFSMRQEEGDKTWWRREDSKPVKRVRPPSIC